MYEDITQEAIAIIQSCEAMASNDKRLFNYNLNYFLNNCAYAKNIIKSEVDRLLKYKMY